MTEETDRRRRRIKQLWLALALLLLVAAVLVVPPLVSVSNYKSRITQLMAASLGRPVRLSSVGVRVLPRPSFVLTDLTVEDDPAYGAEPILHANTVVASIRLLSLWRGRLEIGSVSVDEASLNLVRTADGHWNLDPLFRSVAANAQPGAAPRTSRRLPALEASNSRINIKNGVEKLPFSLLSTDLKFAQGNPGEWRIELRGQPARTDLSLGLADTGVVRLQARVGRAPELRQMPVHLDLEWRDAQLGQLTRLVFGADPGWRGELTGEMHVDGTADAAQVQTRLRAAGVHRAEFAPATPLDFDARCGLVYHYTGRAIENLACDSPLGNGRIHLAGALPGEGVPAHFTVELAQIPVQAGLDALRTVRSDFGPGLEALGTISGKISYGENAAPAKSPAAAANHTAKARPAPARPLAGSLTVEGFQLSGDRLTTPIRLPRLVLEPAATAPGQPRALAATVDLPAGGATPLNLSARLTLAGYQLTVRGQAALARARELARVASMRDAGALDNLAGEPMTVDLAAAGRWMPAPPVAATNLPTGLAAAALASQMSAPRHLSGTVVLHNANWKSDYLANHVEIAQATLHLGQGQIRWDPVEFSYGPVKGTATLAAVEVCATPTPCLPQFELHFDSLDAVALESAILGAHERGTLLSTLIERLRPASSPPWPRLEGTIQADSLILDLVTLTNATATVRTTPDGAEIENFDARLLGGQVHANGSLETGDKPAWTVTAAFQKLSPPEIGKLLHQRFTGAAFDADGKIQLSGYTGKDLADSALGRLHFDWRHGSIAPAAGSAAIPPALAHFDRWSGEAEIAKGAVTIKENQIQQGTRKLAADAAVTLDTPPKMTFAPAKEAPPKR